MHRWLFLLMAAIGALAIGVLAIDSAAAQEPPPVGLTLTETAPGAYRIDVQPSGSVGPYTVRTLISPIGTDYGWGIDLGSSDGTAIAIDLPLPFTGMESARCYRVGFDAASGTEAKPGSNMSLASMDTRACVDAGGVVTFPAFDSVTTPPPPAPSDVRIVRDARINGDSDTWRIEWRDNSTDEIAFDPGIVLLDRPWDEGGSAISGIDMPEVVAGQTTASSIGFLFAPDRPPDPVCGWALVLVFAIGPDSPSIWPGTASVPACFGKGMISFPDAGDGTAKDGNTGAWMLAATVCALGGAAALLVATAGDRRRPRHAAGK